MKEDILKIIRESIALLEQIPVSDTRDCYRKVLIHDKLVLAHKCLEQMIFVEKKGEVTNDTQDDTQTAD